jgi:hypothetical protein
MLRKMMDTQDDAGRPWAWPAMESYCIGRVVSRLEAHPDVVAALQAQWAAAKRVGTEKDGMINVPPERVAEFYAEFGPVAQSPIELDLPLLLFSFLDHAPPMTVADARILESFMEAETSADGTKAA